MRVTDTTSPIPRTFTLEVTEEELERIAWLSFTGEGGDLFPSIKSGNRIHSHIPFDVVEAARKRFRSAVLYDKR